MKLSNIAAILVLLGMFFIMFFSSLDDSATFDEVAHIGAGYTYLTQKDGRLNPEHPPLIKDLAALPLLSLNLNFDKNQDFWTWKNVNDRQWAAGNSLLYESDNGADKILLYSRLPIMGLAIIFGFILFWWTRKNYGAHPAILTLLLFALSPTFLAHSRYVTTDLGAAMAFFLSVIFFVKFLENNDRKSAVYFGIVLGFSLLVKFSLVILLPFFVIVGMRGVRSIGKFAIICFIALSIIYLFYIPHVWNYPLEQNLADAHYTLEGYKTAKFAPELVFTLLSNKFTQPLGQYLHGFLMVAQRTAGGNSAYFLGEISNKGWIHYFPVLFFTKEQIGLYVLILLAILNLYPPTKVGGLLLRKGEKLATPLLYKEGVGGGVFFAFILYYWAWSLWSPLNIGVRHILPTFPFIYILISNSIINPFLSRLTLGGLPLRKGEKLEEVSPLPITKGKRGLRGLGVKGIFLTVIFAWMALEMAFAFPFFLSYYNFLGGGIENGYKIATDSNYDWGQDLKRLKTWAQKRGINKIYLDYFGGGSPKYYFGDKVEFWRHEKGPPPAGSYFAVSVNSLVGAEELYYWLAGKEPIAMAGSSIFIFSF